MPSTNGTGNTIQNAIVRILSAKLHIVQRAAAGAGASAAAVYNGHGDYRERRSRRLFWPPRGQNHGPHT
jgi:hypothetical protein